MATAPVRYLHGGDASEICARATGIKHGRLVEFTFIYGDPDLSVELVLPPAAFREFCVENGCHIEIGDPAVGGWLRRHPETAQLLPLEALRVTETPA